MTWLRPGPGEKYARRSAWLMFPLVIISLIMAGFAHRAMPLEVEDGFPASASQVLTDGSVLIVCINSSSGAGEHGDHEGSCEFCRIASSSHSLDGLPVLESSRLELARTLQHKNEAVPVQSGSCGNPARAPPFA